MSWRRTFSGGTISKILNLAKEVGYTGPGSTTSIAKGGKGNAKTISGVGGAEILYATPSKSNPVALKRAFGLNTLNSDGSGLLNETRTFSPADFPSWSNLVNVFDEYKVHTLAYVLTPIVGDDEEGILSLRYSADNADTIEADIDTEVGNGARLLNLAEAGNPILVPAEFQLEEQFEWHTCATTPPWTNYGDVYLHAKYLPVSSPIMMRNWIANVGFRGLKT